MSDDERKPITDEGLRDVLVALLNGQRAIMVKCGLDERVFPHQGLVDKIRDREI